jgi:hypothetical protein
VSFMEMRVWLIGQPVAGGGFRLELAANQPDAIPVGGFAVRTRGNMDGDPHVAVPRLANDGHDGVGIASASILNGRLGLTLTNGTKLDVGQVVGPAGADPTTAQVAAAVSAWMAANPGRTRLEFSINLVDTYAIGILPGATSKRIACAGLKTTDDISVQPLGVLPDGYLIGAPSCIENGWSRIGYVRPQLGIGANNTIPLKVVAIR